MVRHEGNRFVRSYDTHNGRRYDCYELKDGIATKVAEASTEEEWQLFLTLEPTTPKVDKLGQPLKHGEACPLCRSTKRAFVQ